MTVRPPDRGYIVKGWCPAPGRPMESGDGWLLRLKPFGGILTAQQAAAIAAVARELGNGQLDLTNRGALQLRGIARDRLAEAGAALDRIGLAQGGALAAITIAPQLGQEDGSDPGGLARDCAAVLAAFPDLPAKFGLVIDCGAARLLADCPADLRLERAARPPDRQGETRLLLRIDGRAQGIPTNRADLAGHLSAILSAFCANGISSGRGRMRDWPGAITESFDTQGTTLDESLSPVLAITPQAGRFGDSVLHAAAFGALDADLLALAAETGPIVLTPWRMIALGRRLDHPALISTPDAPLARVQACVGAPACAQAHAPTRGLARRLAATLGRGESLLVSGCAKHCAGGGKRAGLVLTASPAGFAFATSDPAPPVLLPFPPADNAMLHSYETNGQTIYDQSFAIIRAEADLARFPPIEERAAVRMIHASGLVGIEREIAFTPGFGAAAAAALKAGAPVLCDARMVSEGITRARLPAENAVICTLNDPRVPAMAAAMGNTRSAAALELWRPHLAGAVVAIGNAPTALFHLLNMLTDPDCPRPAAIIGCPVGFVGAAESKAALIAAPPLPALVVTGRLGGSAVTVAAVNALASEKE